MKVVLVVLATAVLVLAEPPVPSSQYLPSNQYGAPRPFSPPSSQYGAPAQTAAFVRPSSQYGTPSGQFGASSGQFGTSSGQFGTSSGQFGASSGQFGTPSGQYGAPRPGGSYLPPGQGGSGGYAGRGGYRGGYDDQSEPANYNFKYDVQDAASGNDFGHEESRQGDVAQGKYYVLLPDGRRQTVQYVADNDGYKPQISYEQVSAGIGGGYKGGAGGYQGGAGGYQGGAGGYQGGAGGYQGGGGYQY